MQERSAVKSLAVSMYFPFFRLVAEADFDPLHSGSYRSLSGVVGWLDPFVLKKGEESVPMFKQALRRFSDMVIRAAQVWIEALLHPRTDRERFFDKGLPVQMSLLEGVPQGKHSAGFGKHQFGEPHRIRASACMLDSSDASDDVSPAELADSMVKSLVRRVHVRAKDALVLIAQQLSEDL